jgi:hypothetical protein
MSFKTLESSPSLIKIISGNFQNGTVSTTLSNPFVIKVTNQTGTAASGVLVYFSSSYVPSGSYGYSLSSVSALTNSTGQASTYFTLGNKTGNYLISASVAGSTGLSVGFTAIAKSTYTVSSQNSNNEDQIDADYNSSYFISMDDGYGSSILNYSLHQNYPNPFNPSTRIEYSVPENSVVSIKIFNTLGIEIATLVNRYHNIGRYSIEWNPGNNPAGYYFYALKADKYSETRKMLYLK